MRVIKIIFACLGILISIGTFYIVSNYYDSTNDRFSFIDLNVVEVKKDTGDNTQDEVVGDRPKITFSNVYSLKYKYYQMAGIFFVNGFLVSLIIIWMLQTRFYKISASENIEDIDNLIVLFMTAITLGLILAMTQIVIFNRVYRTTNTKNINSINTKEVVKN
ncbi:MAG: hypothetical protein IJS56_01455 [Bacilli bacterium]|nr:hypothetical protein [Bacilli bacterium]